MTSTYHLHLGFAVVNFVVTWSHIRPLPLHNKPFVAKFKEVFPSVVVRASQKHITGFLQTGTIRKILLCLSVLALHSGFVNGMSLPPTRFAPPFH